nr:MAG TPA: minor structural protein [Caudoviricetes sp.]
MQKGRHMKRKDLEALGITDEALIGKIMDLNGADINEAKGKADEYKAKLDAAGKTIAELEKHKGDAEALQKKLDEYKAAEEKRAAEEKKAAEEKAFSERFDTVSGGRKFLNEYTKKGIAAEFRAALDATENKGKSDKEILDALVRDREGLFENPNKPADVPGLGTVSADKQKENDARRIMGLPIKD